MMPRVLMLPLLAALVVAGPAFPQQPPPRRTPTDEHNQARAENDYLLNVGNKLRDHRYTAKAPATGGATVIQIEIARDGRLIDARIVSSSGAAAIDQGVLEAVRQASPYARLPPEIPGWSATFKLPVASVAEQR
jgi:protein TonB